MRRAASVLALGTLLGATGCNDEPLEQGPLLRSDGASVQVKLQPFGLQIRDASGNTVLATTRGRGADATGGPAVTVDTPDFIAQTLPGWDGYRANEEPWRSGVVARVLDAGEEFAELELTGDGTRMTVRVSVQGARVRLSLAAGASAGASAALNKTSLGFVSHDDESFFGMGERFGTVDHRGFPIYSWAEEGALGKGEEAAIGPENPWPNGPSMTYFPVPFFLSSRGYAVHADTTFRSEVHFASDREDVWRLAVNADRFDTTVYVNADPLDSLDQYTEDTGRPLVPAQWVFGPRRRVSSNYVVDGVPEWKLMRDRDVPCTGVDDSVHFLPALSQKGREQELAAWTKAAHAAGYKVMAYHNPYVAANHPNAAADYAFGKEKGYFVKGPDGEPTLTEFISGELLEIAAVDLTNPAAVAWYQDVLRRALALGYDGWMHDFGEYTPRDAVFFDGRRGDEVHGEYPVLSAKAAHDLMEKERPGDYLFFVRSGYSGTQRFVPAVWGGDAEATFDESQGLPSSLRGGVNLSMSGVPYWGSDMTGFKCITDEPRDKEIFLRWVELGAVSPIMMEQNACANPLGKKTKWKLWDDDETVEHYARHARLHTRLQPYFLTLAREANATGRPLTLHPFLVHPDAPAARAIDDAFYLGPALYTSPVVRRGQVEKKTWLPPGRFVHFDTYALFTGDATVAVPAPLGQLPLFLVENQLLPLLDPSIDTLAPATDPSVTTLAHVADRLDVKVALGPGGTARLELVDGTVLEARRLDADLGNPAGLVPVKAGDLADCASCFFADERGDTKRLRLNGSLASGSDLTLNDVRVTVTGGPERRVRWEVLRI
jgi:alpha-glucosidase (family GH31 glycosyl hydrolase)